MKYLIPFCLLFILACAKEDLPQDYEPEEQFYFPPKNSSTWETKSFESLAWDESKVAELENFLAINNTRAFIIIQNGRIVMEKYWGNNLLNNAPFDMNTDWYWASAGKTLTAALVGIAQEDGLLNINDKTSDYLGVGWTNMAPNKEDLITIKNQLSMTTGLDYNVASLACTIDTCLVYKTDAGAQWYYHNAPYTLLENVVSNAAGVSYNDFCDDYIENQIGMDGRWLPIDDNNVYFSTARDAARFGIFLLKKGQWDGLSVLGDESYINQMTNTSQNLNLSYGYLTWLNGKSSVILPSSTIAFNQSISPNAPSDLYAAMGKDGQFIDVIPSLNMVVIRMGEAPDNSLVPILFHDDMWVKINTLF